MIGLLRGNIARAGEDHIILETHGVGYLVHCDQRTMGELHGRRDAIELAIETQVREDSITLYGFLEDESRGWFKKLQGIQGVGARSALSLLSVLTPAQLTTAVMAQDKAPLTKAAGVGPKLAGRIVSELKDRLPKFAPGAPASAKVPSRGGAAPAGVGQVIEDAISALVQLGYGRSEVFQVVHKLAGQGEPTLDALIRDGLRELSA